MIFKTSDNVEIYYEIIGEGEPLVLIAGLGSDSQSWLPIVSALSQQFKVIIFDNRGAGRTTPHDVDISMSLIANDCIALLSHLGLSSANILGHSMGGFVALDIAIRYPEKLNKLILSCTSYSNSQRNNSLFLRWVSNRNSEQDLDKWYLDLFYWLFSDAFFENEASLNEIIEYTLKYPYPPTQTAFENQVKAIAEFNCKQELSNVRSKTLVISGANDIIFLPKVGRELASLIGSSEYIELKDSAHSIHVEQPNNFVRSVCDFLNKR